MKCNKCGADLLKSDFCPECHADVSFYKRAAAASNSYYNKGLEQAGVRDLSGAWVRIPNLGRQRKPETGGSS